jgi:hypothetical protein
MIQQQQETNPEYAYGVISNTFIVSAGARGELLLGFIILGVA